MGTIEIDNTNRQASHTERFELSRDKFYDKVK